MGGGFWQGLRTWRGAWDGGSETAARVPRGVHGARRWSGCATCAMTLVAVANELGLHETVLRRWIRKHGEPGMGLARRSSTAASSGPSPADLAAETARLKREDARPSMERDIGRMAALVRGTRPPDEVWASGMSTGTSGRSPSCAACWGCPSAATRAWRSRPESARSRANRALLDDGRLAHAESGGSYGAPRVHAVLRTLGRRVGRHRVARPDRAGRACGAGRPCRAACAPPRAGMGTPSLPTGSGAASRRRGPTRSGSGI